MSEQKDPIILENEFYSKDFNFSYSSINMLLYCPNLFYRQYVLRQREDKLDSYLIEGKVVHSLLLDNDQFDKNFIVSPSKLPSENTRKVIDKVWFKYTSLDMIATDYSGISVELAGCQVQILTTLQEMNLHQSLKTDEQRIAKIIS